MRLGAPVPSGSSPEAWIETLRARGFRTAYWPLDDDAGADDVAAYASAAAAADVVIAEVGAWSNPLSPDDATRVIAIERCKSRLELADRVGARCCVNIAGSRSESLDGPHPDNLSRDTFALIVDTVRDIIDTVGPQRTHYTLEPMPWALIRLAMASTARLAVVPAQDLLSLGSETRMNTPGSDSGNWSWQAPTWCGSTQLTATTMSAKC